MLNFSQNGKIACKGVVISNVMKEEYVGRYERDDVYLLLAYPT